MFDGGGLCTVVLIVLTVLIVIELIVLEENCWSWIVFNNVVWCWWVKSIDGKLLMLDVVC